MWALLVDSAGSSILELSIRAIIGAIVALFILLLLASVFRRNEEIKQYAFVVSFSDHFANQHDFIYDSLGPYARDRT